MEYEAIRMVLMMTMMAVIVYFFYDLIYYNTYYMLNNAAAARQVADRALKTINFREEQEKFNVWVARLNLENLYVLCLCVRARALACSYLFRCACRL